MFQNKRGKILQDYLSFKQILQSFLWLFLKHFMSLTWLSFLWTSSPLSKLSPLAVSHSCPSLLAQTVALFYSDSDKLPVGVGNPSCIPHLNTHSTTLSHSFFFFSFFPHTKLTHRGYPSIPRLVMLAREQVKVTICLTTPACTCMHTGEQLSWDKWHMCTLSQRTHTDKMGY